MAPPIVAGIAWGARLAWPHIARIGAPLAARVGTMAKGALGFAAKRPVTTFVGAELATGGAMTGYALDQAQEAGGNMLSNMASSFMENPAMQAGGMLGGAFLMNQVLGNGSMMGTLGMAGIGMAGIMPLMSANNGFQRAGGALMSIFRGVVDGFRNNDWSGLQEGFSQLGGVYAEGINNLTGIDLRGNSPGVNGPGSPAIAGVTGPAGAATGVAAADTGLQTGLGTGELGQVAAASAGEPDADMERGAALIAQAEAAAEKPSIGEMRRNARHGLN
ncbi:MAG: hypothetical protein AAF213_13210 [Pseudomonadota bacterium]